MTMPRVICEVAFAKDVIGDGSPLWTDVSDSVEWWRGVRISRRRSHELDEVQPGVLALALTNLDGRFTASRYGSPYWPNVKINRMIRIRAVYPGGVNMLQSGQARGSDVNAFSGSQGTVSIDTVVVPPGQTTAVKWDADTLSNGTFLRLGVKSTASPTDEGLSVVGGAVYSVQCQARRDASWSLVMALRVRWYDQEGDQISDSTGPSVTLTTSWQTLTYSPTAPPNAAFARIVLVSTATTPGDVIIYTSAWQFERASAPTAWSDPGTSHTRYTGFVDKWPTAWDNGFIGIAQITATDRQKLLSRDRIRGAVPEQTLGSNPTFFYPLAEAEDTTSAGNLATTNQPDLTIQSAGSGGGLAFGAAGGPDGQTGVLLTPTNTDNGRLLGVQQLYTALSGTGISLAAWVRIDSALAADQRILYVDNGSDVTHIRLNYNPATTTLTVGVRLPNGSHFPSANSVTLTNGLHLVVVTIQFSGIPQITIRAYVDGTQVISTTQATTASSMPRLPRLRVGGLPGTAADPPQLMQGLIAAVAGWNTVLTSTQASDLWATRNGFAGELAGARAARIAAWAGAPRTAIDLGSSAMDRHPNAEQAPLAALKLVAKSEAGIFFIAADDSVTLHGRARRQLPTAPSITLTADQLGGDTNFVMDDQLLINDVQVTRSGGSTTRAVNEASIKEHGGVYAASIETLLYTDTEAIDRANYTLSTYGDPQPRAGVFRIDAHAMPELMPQMLASEIGQRIQVTGLPAEAPAPSLDLWCEGVQEYITDEVYTFTFDTSPVRQTPIFVLDDPVYGTLNNNYLGW